MHILPTITTNACLGLFFFFGSFEMLVYIPHAAIIKDGRVQLYILTLYSTESNTAYQYIVQVIHHVSTNILNVISGLNKYSMKVQLLTLTGHKSTQ